MWFKVLGEDHEALYIEHGDGSLESLGAGLQVSTVWAKVPDPGRPCSFYYWNMDTGDVQWEAPDLFLVSPSANDGLSSTPVESIYSSDPPTGTIQANCSAPSSASPPQASMPISSAAAPSASAVAPSASAAAGLAPRVGWENWNFRELYVAKLAVKDLEPDGGVLLKELPQYARSLSRLYENRSRHILPGGEADPFNHASQRYEEAPLDSEGKPVLDSGLPDDWMRVGSPVTVYRKLRTKVAVISHPCECTLVAFEGGHAYVRLPGELSPSVELVSMDALTPVRRGAFVKVRGSDSAQSQGPDGQIARVVSRSAKTKRYICELLDGTPLPPLNFRRAAHVPRVTGLNLGRIPRILTGHCEQACTFLDSQGIEHPFKLSLPPRFAEAPYQKRTRWPLLVYLPGEDGRSFYDYGDEELLRSSPGLEYAFQGFVVVSPIVDWRRGGLSPEWLQAFVRHLFGALWLDRDRIYLTGYSLGGMGTWMLASALDDVFTAIAPCASCHSEAHQDRLVETIVTLPACITHSSREDGPHPMSKEQSLWRRLAARNYWIVAFANDDTHDAIRHSVYCRSDCLYKWFLSHTSERVHDPRYDP